MALFTTYLAQLKGVKLSDRGLKNPKIYYVMRNRGNNEVAPSNDFLPHFLKLRKRYEEIGDRQQLRELWEQYKENYFFQIGLDKDAQDWIKRVAEESLWQDVVLVCFEKDYLHCHRHLLANEIVRLHPEVCYVGELKLKEFPLRKCRVCGKEATNKEELAFFTSHFECKYGKDNVCKECHKLQAKEHYQQNQEHLRQLKREYWLTHKEQYASNNRKYRKRHPEKIHAQNLAHYHVPIGNNCENCGTTKNLQRHHPDYSKPLEIVTLCGRCHLSLPERSTR